FGVDGLETSAVLAFGRLAAGVPEQLHGLRVGLAVSYELDFRFEVPVAGQEVWPAIQIVIEVKAAELEEGPAGPGHSFGRGEVGETQPLAILQREQAVRFVGEVGNEKGELTGANLGDVDSHRAALLALRVCDAGFLAHLDEAAAALAVRDVVEQEIA